MSRCEAVRHCTLPWNHAGACDFGAPQEGAVPSSGETEEPMSLWEQLRLWARADVVAARLDPMYVVTSAALDYRERKVRELVAASTGESEKRIEGWAKRRPEPGDEGALVVSHFFAEGGYIVAEETELELDDFVGALLAEVERLRPPQGHRGTTHWEGCWESRGHHDCAVAEIQRLRAQPSHQQQPGWLPIESAPKDGTHVLLTDGEMISCGYWCGSQHAPRWMSDSGEPTHWQPLPEPPANA